MAIENAQGCMLCLQGARRVYRRWLCWASSTKRSVSGDSPRLVCFSDCAISACAVLPICTVPASRMPCGGEGNGRRQCPVRLDHAHAVTVFFQVAICRRQEENRAARDFQQLFRRYIQQKGAVRRQPFQPADISIRQAMLPPSRSEIPGQRVGDLLVNRPAARASPGDGR